MSDTILLPSRYSDQDYLLASLFEIFPLFDPDVLVELFALNDNNFDYTLDYLQFNDASSHTPSSSCSLHGSALVRANWTPATIKKVNLQCVIDEEIANRMSANPQFSPPRQQHQRDKLHCNYFSIHESVLQARETDEKQNGNAWHIRRSQHGRHVEPTLGAKLKVDLLACLYPTVDRAMLEEIFAANHCEVNLSLAWMCELYPNLPHAHLSEADRLLHGLDVISTTNLNSAFCNSRDAVDEFAAIDENNCIRDISVLVRTMLDHPKAILDLPTCRYFDSFRLEAQHHAEKRNRSFVIGGSRGMDGSTLRDMIKAHNNAAICIFHENNRNNSVADFIDLHHLFVKEALQALRVVCEWRVAMNQPGHINSVLVGARAHRAFLTVITGAGRHSMGQKAHLRPAVENFLQQLRLPFKPGPNDGSIIGKFI